MNIVELSFRLPTELLTRKVHLASLTVIMATEHIDVNYVANLARIELTEEEVTTFKPQLEAILGYIDKLKELNVDGIEPTAHASPVFDTIREDIARPGLERDAFLQNAPDQSNGLLRVPKVIEEA